MYIGRIKSKLNTDKIQINEKKIKVIFVCSETVFSTYKGE